MVGHTYPQAIPALTDAGATAPGIDAGQPITYDECAAAKTDERRFVGSPAYARATARRLTIDNATIEATNQQGGTPGWFNQAFNQAMAPFIQQLQASNKVSLSLRCVRFG